MTNSKEIKEIIIKIANEAYESGYLYKKCFGGYPSIPKNKFIERLKIRLDQEL